MNVPQFYELMGYRMQFVINSFVGRGEIGASAVAREMMRELAMTRWLESPLWGYGFDSFKYYAESTIGKFVYSHSNYTELLHNGGIIYFIIYYYIFYKLIKVFMRNKNKPEKYRAYALAVLICMLVFDYGAVSYSLARMHIMLALAFRVLTFSEDKPITERPVGFVRE
jgi:O-antigen ligase